MKSIKLSGLETRLNLVIRGLRDKELETAKKYRTLLVSVMGLGE